MHSALAIKPTMLFITNIQSKIMTVGVHPKTGYMGSCPEAVFTHISIHYS